MPRLSSHEKIVHLVILRNYAITTSDYNYLRKIQRFYLGETTIFLVKMQTVIDVKIKLM